MNKPPSGLPARATPLTIAYLLVTAALVAIFHQRIALWPAILCAHVIVSVALVWLSGVESSSAIVRAVLDWHPIVLFPIYVRPFPAGAGKGQISIGGGEEPIWSRDGRALFYREGRTWMAAAVHLTPEFTSETPTRLFEGHFANVGGRSYDVAGDGRRFLVLQAADTAPVTHLNIVLHWEQQLKRMAEHTAAPAR